LRDGTSNNRPPILNSAHVLALMEASGAESTPRPKMLSPSGEGPAVSGLRTCLDPGTAPTGFLASTGLVGHADAAIVILHSTPNARATLSATE